MFTPATGQVPAGQPVITTFTISDTNSGGVAATDSTTSVIAKALASITTLAAYDGTDGTGPTGTLIADANGDLFGTAEGGGANNNGAVFEIAKTIGGYASAPSTLISFNYWNGWIPSGGLIADTNGDLFGTTANGGANNDGTVFEVAWTGAGFATTPTTLATVNGANGQNPANSLTADAIGDLFGTTSNGGAFGHGSVFEIAKTAGGYASTPTTLVSFDGSDGGQPEGTLISDANGDLFGTTSTGGANSDGTVFEIVKTSGGYANTPAALIAFNGTNGANPWGGLMVDANGDLFGTTETGGANGDGTVFEIVKTSGGYTNTPAVLIAFNGTNGAHPFGGLIEDANGDLFGTTESGGSNNDGTVFEIVKTSSGYANNPAALINFNGTNGTSPYSDLIADASGDLFGTTSSGGAHNDGTVFELTNTGFQTQVACFLEGTSILTTHGSRPVESLSAGDQTVTLLGGSGQIVWTGHRTIDCRRHPRPETVWPIRVAGGAFGSGLPNRDLYLSPDHAVYWKGVLVPVKLLINGATIRQIPRASVTYHHIELARHDLILAEGLPAETYLDTGNRTMFETVGQPLTLHPDFETGQQARASLSCAPFVDQPGDVEPIWRALADRAAAMGWPLPETPALVDEPDLHLAIDAQRIDPVVVADGSYIFVLPADEAPVRMVSRSAIPRDARPWVSDDRRLGVRVGAMTFRSGRGGAEDIAMDDPRLDRGWWAVECDDRALCRWTWGEACLPVRGPGILTVKVVETMRYAVGALRDEMRQTAVG